MQISKWGNSFAIRLPMQVVKALGLKEGDPMQVQVTDDKSFTVQRDEKRKRAIENLRRLAKLNGPPLPGFKFNREEAHARGRVL